jgi:CheY-like chemotaxis protein
MSVSPAITVLHVEDDTDLAHAVERTFELLGFAGEMLHATTVAEAIRVLTTRRDADQPVDLIVSDMNLPDAHATEIVRVVKSNPAWAAIPMVLLSGDSDHDIVTAAYALGANSYVPKHGDDLFSALEAMYRFWFQEVQLPRTRVGRGDEFLGWLVYYRARLSELFAELARAFGADEDRSQFWLGLSLFQANQANLASFVRRSPRRWTPTGDTADRVIRLRDGRASALAEVHRRFARVPGPSMEEALGWAMKLERDFDPELFATGLSRFFPSQPAAAAVLRDSVAGHLEALGQRALRDAPSLREPAERVLAQARALRGGR